MRRKPEQDPKYAIRLTADIAIKALSPAINDPTAVRRGITRAKIHDTLRMPVLCHGAEANAISTLILPTAPLTASAGWLESSGI